MPIRTQRPRTLAVIVEQPNNNEKTRIKKSRNMLGLRTTIYKVGNIQKATEWYSKAFETNPYFNKP
jgi:hypothetical protein